MWSGTLTWVHDALASSTRAFFIYDRSLNFIITRTEYVTSDLLTFIVAWCLTIIIVNGISLDLGSIVCDNNELEANLNEIKSKLPEGIEIPESLKNVTLPSMDDFKKVVKEKCDKVSGGETAFASVEEAAEKMKECATSMINVEQLQKDIEEAQPKGELDTVFNRLTLENPLAWKRNLTNPNNYFYWRFRLTDTVATEPLLLIVWIILRESLSRVLTPKKSKARRLSWKFSQIYWISYATKMATRLRSSSPRRDRNALATRKIYCSTASIQHSASTCLRSRKWLKPKKCQQLCHIWSWASNSASKGNVRSS